MKWKYICFQLDGKRQSPDPYETLKEAEKFIDGLDFSHLWRIYKLVEV
jgi:hypothetical protein